MIQVLPGFLQRYYKYGVKLYTDDVVWLVYIQMLSVYIYYRAFLLSLHQHIVIFFNAVYIKIDRDTTDITQSMSTRFAYGHVVVRC